MFSIISWQFESLVTFLLLCAMIAHVRWNYSSGNISALMTSSQRIIHNFSRHSVWLSIVSMSWIIREQCAKQSWDPIIHVTRVCMIQSTQKLPSNFSRIYRNLNIHFEHTIIRSQPYSSLFCSIWKTVRLLVSNLLSKACSAPLISVSHSVFTRLSPFSRFGKK